MHVLSKQTRQFIPKPLTCVWPGTSLKCQRALEMANQGTPINNSSPYTFPCESILHLWIWFLCRCRGCESPPHSNAWVSRSRAPISGWVHECPFPSSINLSGRCCLSDFFQSVIRLHSNPFSARSEPRPRPFTRSPSIDSHYRSGAAVLGIRNRHSSPGSTFHFRSTWWFRSSAD